MIYRIAAPYNADLLKDQISQHPFLALEGSFLVLDAGAEGREDALARIARTAEDMRQLIITGITDAQAAAAGRVVNAIARLKGDVQRDYKTRARVEHDTPSVENTETVENADQGESQLQATGVASISSLSQMRDDTHATTKEVTDNGKARFNEQPNSPQPVEGGSDARNGKRRRRSAEQ